MERKRNELWWLGSCIPCGFATWATFAYIGLRTRQRRWVVAGAGYLAALLAAVVANAVGNDEDPTLGVIASVLMLTVWIGGMVHAQLVRDEVRARLSGWRSAAEEAHDRIDERRAAQALARTDPELARELGIGRPDRADAQHRGVIDINNADVGAIASLPGIEPELARSIVRVRDELEGFSSLPDMDMVLDLPAVTIKSLGTRTVFLAHSSD